MRLSTLLAAVAVALALAAPASADTGSISNVRETGTGTVAASYAVSWQTCKDYGSGFMGCSWYAVAYARPVSAGGCIADDGSIAWVGDWHDAPGTEGVVDDTFYPDDVGDVRLCLYVKPEGRAPALVAQAVYKRPRLSLRKARSEARRVLRKRYGSRFRRGRAVHTHCYRPAEDEGARRMATCRVRWHYGRKRKYRVFVDLRRLDENRIGHAVTRARP